MTGLKRAVFIDRDGTIIEEVDRLTRIEEIKLIQGTAEAIKKLNNAGFLTVVITNQSVVGRGMISVKELQKIHQKLLNDLKNQNAIIDAIYFCPHIPEDNCECRKPKTGLIKKAVNDLSIDLCSSFFIGDNLKDMLLAKDAGIKGLLVRTGYGINVEKQLNKNEFNIFDSILEAVYYILN